MRSCSAAFVAGPAALADTWRESSPRISTFSTLLPGCTVRWELPATTSTSSGGRVERLLTTTGGCVFAGSGLDASLGVSTGAPVVFGATLALGLSTFAATVWLGLVGTTACEAAGRLSEVASHSASSSEPNQNS